jgi:hypothetical protein
MANGNDARVPRLNRSTSLNAWVLIAVAIVGFGILHVVGEMMLHKASHISSTEGSLTAIHGD